MSVNHHTSLKDRYQLESGQALLTGIHALVRGMLEQRKRDRTAGLDTGLFCSGYQGSPLGTLDKEMFANSELVKSNQIVFSPGLNEELAATSVMGSQLAPKFPGSNVEGVVGIWYGKAPGLDRATDAIRHANLAGTHPKGGAVILCGDDPASKSSTVPSASERSLAALMIPTLYPSSPQETIDMIQHAVAMSRYSGAWTAVKVVTDVADSYARVDLGKTLSIPDLKGTHVPDSNLLAPNNLVLEKDLIEQRIPRALEYARKAGLNQIISKAPQAKLGIIASGKTYVDVCQSFALLGTSCEELGIRLLKLDVLWPSDPKLFAEFSKGLQEIMVIEEKGPFIETAVCKALYSKGPLITGQEDEDGVLLSPSGQLTVDAILKALVKRCKANAIEVDASVLEEMAQATVVVDQDIARIPYFCSGCPHNSSTPHDGLVGAGIGCHTMVLLAPKGKGEITGITQMGGEGAQWIGIAPWTTDAHFVQNLGDGTFHHSASLAVRASIAAGTNITYKILVNSAVAMTGGQDIPGGMELSKLTHALWAEGVVKTIVCTEDQSKYDAKDFPKNVEWRSRDDIQDCTKQLSLIQGTTVLVYDGECAAERRRKRKRGQAPKATKRVIINERVCEGCGDCGKKSSCLSVVPKATVFGRKTEIAQDSCNTDYSCLAGDCPSFITVKTDQPVAKPIRKAPLVEAKPLLQKQARIRVVGIGGTGIVTTSQVLAQAAIIDGNNVKGLDQTGLAQKGGTVTSDIEINIDGSGKIPPSKADVFVVLDLVAGTATQPLTACGANTQVIASSSLAPTIEAVVDPKVKMPTAESLALQLETRCKSVESLPFHDYAKTLFGNTMLASMMMLGYAIQKQIIPVSAKAMLEALELNRADVARNSEAFRWGQALAEGHGILNPVAELPKAPSWAKQIATQSALSEAAACFAGELAKWGNKKQGKAFLAKTSEIQTLLKATPIPQATQQKMMETLTAELFNFWAYKDEYEIARLHLDKAEIAKREALFGDAKITYHLQPPFLKALGFKHKLKFGEWFTPVFKMLKAMKVLRGTPLDLFGMSKVRKTEKAMKDEYLSWIQAAVALASKQNASQVQEIFSVAKQIRGYEDVKLNNLREVREIVKAILLELETGKIRINLPMV